MQKHWKNPKQWPKVPNQLKDSLTGLRKWKLKCNAIITEWCYGSIIYDVRLWLSVCPSVTNWRSVKMASVCSCTFYPCISLLHSFVTELRPASYEVFMEVFLPSHCACVVSPCLLIRHQWASFFIVDPEIQPSNTVSTSTACTATRAVLRVSKVQRKWSIMCWVLLFALCMTCCRLADSLGST